MIIPCHMYNLWLGILLIAAKQTIVSITVEG